MIAAANRSLYKHTFIDHKPLITLFGKKEVEKIPIRIQRYRIRLMRYVIDMKYIQGKTNIGANAISRYPAQ